MAMTKPSDVFIPEIIGQLANEVLQNNDSLLQSGYIADARNLAFRSGVGSTIEFPNIATNTATVLTDDLDGNAEAAGSFTMGSDQETVLDKIVPMDIFDKTIRAMAGGQVDANAYVAKFVAKQVRLAIQGTLIAKAAASSLTYTDPAGAVSWDGLMQAKTKNWGENAYGDAPPLFVAHSKVVHDLLISDEAKKAGVYGLAGTIESGKIMSFAGMKVLPLDSITSTEGVYANLILQKDALSLWNMIDVQYGEIRKAHTTLWQMDWWFSYAAHLSTDVPVGCIVYNAASSLD